MKSEKRNPAQRVYLTIFVCLVMFAVSFPLYGYRIMYAEQFYKLYHRNLYQYSNDYRENIWYLEQALKHPFVNPLHALARIETPEQWERYRYLFAMHVNLKLVEQYRYWAARYDKRTAYFFNAPFKQQNLESLEIAEKLYNNALYYWEEALFWWEEVKKQPRHHFQEVQFWEDEWIRIYTGDLDYHDFISMDLERLQSVREAFLEMDESTY